MNSTTRISWRIPEEFFPSAGRTVRFLTVSIVICFLLPASFATPARAAAEAIADKTAEVDGLKLHYLTAGHGPDSNPVARLHPNFAHVETNHSTFGREIYRDCA